MSRFSKGTFDHDGNGFPGGSRPAKEKTMTKKPKKAPRKAADKPKAEPVPHKGPVQPTFSVAGNVGDKKRDPGEVKIIEAGRNARLNSVAREDNPKSGNEADLWLEGWDSLG
jgi:hypothetical protein